MQMARLHQERREGMRMGGRACLGSRGEAGCGGAAALGAAAAAAAAAAARPPQRSPTRPAGQAPQQLVCLTGCHLDRKERRK